MKVYDFLKALYNATRNSNHQLEFDIDGSKYLVTGFSYNAKSKRLDLIVSKEREDVQGVNTHDTLGSILLLSKPDDEVTVWIDEYERYNIEDAYYLYGCAMKLIVNGFD